MNHVPGHHVAGSRPAVLENRPISVDAHIVLAGGCVAVQFRGGRYDLCLFTEPAGGFFHHSKSLGQEVHQDFLRFLVPLLLKLVDFPIDLFLSNDITVNQSGRFSLQAFDLFIRFLQMIFDPSPEIGSPGPQLIVRNGGKFTEFGLRQIHDRKQFFQVAVTLAAEDLSDGFIENSKALWVGQKGGQRYSLFPALAEGIRCQSIVIFERSRQQAGAGEAVFLSLKKYRFTCVSCAYVWSALLTGLLFPKENSAQPWMKRPLTSGDEVVVNVPTFRIFQQGSTSIELQNPSIDEGRMREEGAINSSVAGNGS